MSLKKSLLCCFFAGMVLMFSGCAMLCHDPSPEQKTDIGKIEFLDYATCSRLSVVEHGYRRDEEGHLVVTVKWHNSSPKDYEAQIRRVFWTSDGNRERGSFRWDLQTFRGDGITTCSWRSYTDKAVMYEIEVRKSR
jgi:hypothetical protein